jgi:hypothetical protein
MCRYGRVRVAAQYVPIWAGTSSRSICADPEHFAKWVISRIWVIWTEGRRAITTKALVVESLSEYVQESAPQKIGKSRANGAGFVDWVCT